MTLLHAAEQLTTATFVLEEAACDCGQMDDADLSDLIDEASDIIAIASNGWVKGRVLRTYRPVWNDGYCWPLDAEWATEVDDGIPLPNRPENIAVRVDGALIASTEYKIVRIDDLAPNLVRINADYERVAWPRTNKPYAPETDTGVFQVAFENGVGVEEPAVNDAAAELVCHLAKDWNPNREIRRTKADSVSLGGATMSRRNAAERVREGEFDLRLMDRLLAMFDRSSSAEVWSPELAGPWRMLSVS